MSEREPGTIAGVGLSHPDKVLYPGQGVTKADLARYYEDVAEWMLPHLHKRLVSLVRCPKGQGRECFYQRHPTGTLPGEFRIRPIREKSGKRADYIHIESVAGLIAGVQVGVLEFHVWGSRIDRLERPDRLVFDLDPGAGVGFSRVRDTARDLRKLLRKLDLECFPMTTGGKGLHVIVPIERYSSWDEAGDFTRACAKALVERNPEHYVAESAHRKRRGKVFIDYLRNSRGNTAICPYSSRRHPGAPVATPISWDELDQVENARAWHIGNIRARLGALRNDPWADAASVRQRLGKNRMRRLEQYRE